MSWFTRLKNALYSAPLDDALDEEIRDHLERRAEAFRAQGMSAEDAERRARQAFGNAARIREQSRDIRLSAALDSTLQDLRYAWRGMWRSPGFTLTALLSLGLAIGANTAIYAIVDAAMLRPLPLPETERLFTLAAPSLDLTDNRGETDSFSYPLYLDLRTAAGSAARLALFSRISRVEAQIGDRTAPVERLLQQYVSGEAFETLRVAPHLGRLFSSDEDAGPGIARVAVISFDYWHRRFDGDPGVLDREIGFGSGAYRIIGIAPAGFSGVEPGKFVDVWVPVMTFDPGVFSNPASSLFHIVGRLGEGTSRDQLQARLQPAFHRGQEEMIGRATGIPPAILKQFGERGIRVRGGAVGLSEFRRTFGRPLWIVLGVAATILLIACANVASLLLGRSAARATEMAVRTSLGAGRSRLVRQLLTESTLLSLMAGCLGWLSARVMAPVLVALLWKRTDPVRFDLAMDTRVLVFCAAVCTVSALLFGLLPAWQCASASPMATLRAGRRSDKLRITRYFVAIQVAFAFCLVVAGAAFLFTLLTLFRVDTGLSEGRVAVLTMRSDLGITQDALLRTLQLQRRVAALPNVQGAAVAWTSMFEGSRRMERVQVAGQSPLEREEIFYRVSPGFFATLEIPLLGGRDLDVRDTDVAQPIGTVVNRAFAQMYFGGQSALGKQFRRTDGTRHQIVGIVANAHYTDLRSGPEPVAYWPMKPPRLFTMYVRSTVDQASVVGMVEQETRRSEPGIQLTDATTLDALIGTTTVRETLLATIGGAFASLGLVLAAIGLFGVLNYSVVQRTRELGIRAALGAGRATLVSLVMRDLLGIVAGGLTAGVIGSLAVMRLIRSQLFGLGAAEPAVMAVAAVVFLCATTIAALVPAARAAAIDPIVAVRRE
ncbi:MAG TPA: ABC transporter permease [Gemmatimonadaceae bacterium]